VTKVIVLYSYGATAGINRTIEEQIFSPILYIPFLNITNMKKLILLSSLAALALVVSNCSGSRKLAKAAPKLNFETNLKAVVMSECSPCHIPSKGGNKKPYDNYANVKTDIDEMIRRIELNPGERGFMPFRKTTKLSDSTIALFKQWRADGVIEK
jgi:uncharacterized membrane protein